MKSLSVTKLARFAAMCMSCAIVIGNINPSFAQSTDRDNPTPLTTNTLSMQGEKLGEEHKVYYYKFTPKSGKIKITLDAECKSESAYATISVQNPDGEELHEIMVIVSGGNPGRKVKTMELPLNTPTILKIRTYGSAPQYRIKIDGDWTELPSASTPPEQATVVANPVQGSVAANPAKPYGVDTCKQGYVWREAQPNDRICVTPAVRTRTRRENNLAAQRRKPNGGAYGPNTCKQGYVWREATENDPVCVIPAVRAQAAEDNKRAGERRVP
jgi:hypothetical protein